MRRAMIVGRVFAAMSLLVAASPPLMACRGMSAADARIAHRNDLLEQRGIVRNLTRAADSIHVAVATKTATAMEDVELEVRSTVFGSAPARPVVSFPASNEITIGCAAAADYRNIVIEKGHTYLIYVADGKLLRAGDRRRVAGQISWSEENAIVRKTDRWKMPPAAADFAKAEAEFEAAQARWRAVGISNYSFGWRDRGAVLLAPRCADAVIRVQVESGKAMTPVVEKGTATCPRGKRDIDMNVPTSVDAAFEQMGRLVDMGADQIRIHASYDPSTGIPVAFYAQKLKFEDNDEGFEIMGFEVSKP